MVVIDSDLLLLVLDPDVSAPPVSLARERVNHLLAGLSQARTQVLVPAPVLAEVLVKAGPATQGYLEQLRKSPNIRIAPFDAKAAVECAELINEGLRQRRRAATPTESRDKIKFDQLIVAIARANGAECLYAHDAGLRASSERAGVPTKGLADLEVPAEALQTAMNLTVSETDKD
jgi:predicted nucleic acid-binding protein